MHWRSKHLTTASVLSISNTYSVTRTSAQSTVTAAVQRIGDLFGSIYELFLRVFLLHREEFNSRIVAVLYSLLAIPLPNKVLRSTYERARQILEAHVYGQELLTIMDCARVYQDGDRFKIDWESVGLLSEAGISVCSLSEHRQ